MSIAVGIDLGTTNTVVGAVKDGRAVTLADEGGRRLIPSIVSFHPSGKVLVGEHGKERRIVDPQNTIYSIKRLIGRTWDQDEVQRARRAFPFEIIEGPKQGVAVVARGETYTLAEISAFVLRRAKGVAEAALGETVDKAVITVPANFNDLQRAATKLAGKLAGLEILRILNEPTAAALAYGQGAGEKERLAIYDLGGGTFDITLLDLAGNVFEVLATGGDTALGGDDIDQLIAERMAVQMLERLRIDPRTDPIARATLRARGEVLKLELSTKETAAIELNDIVRGEEGVYLPFHFTMTRAELEVLTGPLIERTLQTCRFSIETIGARISDLNRVILVGGSTRMPLVVRKVEEYFKRPATGRVNPDEVVALGAAIQASALSRMARGKVITEVAHTEPQTNAQPPLPPGVLPLVGVAPPSPKRSLEAPTPLNIPPPPQWVGAGAQAPTPVVGKGAAPAGPDPWDSPELEPLAGAPTTEFSFELELPPAPSRPPGPAKGPPLPPVTAPPKGPPPLRKVAPTVDALPTFPKVAANLTMKGLPPPPGEAPRESARPRPAAPSVRPPEVPSRPAPPAGRAAPLLIDVTPLSLGVEVAGGFTDLLIGANTPVPCDRTRVFRTASDNQTSVVVRVAQGESTKFAQNTCLGDLELSGLKAAPRGEVKIAVTFEIDADGILDVRAKDVATGRETQAKMHLLGAQTDAKEVEAMVERQRQHAVE